MFIVTNTIQTEKDATDKVIEKFMGHGKVSTQGVKGFLGLELLQTRTTGEFDELVVLSRWETESDQKEWVKSEAFKKAHGRTEETRHEKPKNIGIISNEIKEYDQKFAQ
ncbi:MULTISPECIES: antibiotic biosynthesis monooxygenase [Carnobacterium]|uniref:ABM domain-containing protein n=1 Tax=Carnobacterium divergens TaxID=2748 RepID=A0A2R8A4G2_CARDV|nr:MULTISPECIES: antibiotic biosynthesis monooxygenase [Carnobacterium]MCO6018951.1 antibiotic biosynthesis monooxygenase [Carnobacterium divergens]MDT1939453.1 antibiotic biosynthesis monooxygenase [Carnobacterium divergens]MDT1941891.1 antibiotic biosynthesis monooxygenase [Carnobacterium divergens]MDT1947689.1 antibiotic biosynthesis monooxygenase [Carnobacterium divergens]MDT1950177.1 antibiotic biosynthesis monooxygenase [Carnobacterium divergens]